MPSPSASTGARNYRARQTASLVGGWPLLDSTGSALSTGVAGTLVLPHAHRTFALQGRLSTGGSTGVTVNLQGSIDGENWAAAGATPTITLTTAATVVVSTSSVPFVQVRAVIAAATTSTGLGSLPADTAAGGHLYLAAIP